MPEEPVSRLYPGGSSGCLLLHGFSGSPLEMYPMAEALAAHGWTALVARLAGHGTSPHDLARSSWREWVDSARDALAQLRGRCTSVALVGLSMGGALALYLAAEEPVDAVVAISTPIRVHPLMAAASRRAARIMPMAPVFFRWRPRERPMRRFLSPYRRVPLGATAELEMLLRLMREALPSVRVPVLVVQGRRDWVIPRESASRIAAQASAAPTRLLWLPHSGHLATLDRDRHMLYEETHHFLLEFLASAHISGDRRPIKPALG